MGRKTSSTALDNAARDALNGILATSVKKIREYGGMIYMEGNLYKAMPPRTQGDPAKVDVGQHQPNCGCPTGTTPVAYYHTHPVYQIAGMKGQYNEFSDEDKSVARENNLDAAYLGSLDGSFLRFDCQENKTITLPDRLKNTE